MSVRFMSAGNGSRLSHINLTNKVTKRLEGTGRFSYIRKVNLRLKSGPLMEKMGVQILF